jgi:NAD(P)-dependent dehydrogenase (short-subunit alcohol dehydrogenase family)
MSTVLVTGAFGGIGYELAKLFARDRHNLILVARSGDKLAQVRSHESFLGHSPLTNFVARRIPCSRP